MTTASRLSAPGRPRRRSFSAFRASTVALGLAALTATVPVPGAIAADHNEAPGATADPAADITDFYSWHSGDKLVAVIDFAGVNASMNGPLYDNDVAYGVHIDNDGDYVADHDVWVRFGQNGAGEWGMKVENLPGSSGTISGAVGTNLDAGGGRFVFAGWREDPFFFDLEGFTNTLQTGTLSFDSTRDSFAGLNVTAIVLEMSLSAAMESGSNLNIWATTARK